MKRRSRWRAPDPANAPNPRTFPTDRQLAVLSRLAWRRYSTTSNLLHFTGGEYTCFTEFLGQLYDGGYIRFEDQYLPKDNIHGRDMVWAITDKGRETLVKEVRKPLYAATKQYPHEFLSSAIYDSIEIGASESPYSYEGWDKLREDPRVPASTSDFPFSIKLPSGTRLRLDGVPPPFVIRKEGRSRCFPGVEVDRATEPVWSKDEREKWQSKFEAIIEFVGTRTFRSYYGFDSCLIPIYTINQGSMKNIMHYALWKYGFLGYLTFQVVPDWAKLRVFPKPNSASFTQPYYTLADLIYKNGKPANFDDKPVGVKGPSFYLGEF